MIRHLILPSLLWFLLGSLYSTEAFSQSSFVYPVEDEAIQYYAQPNDPVARLQRRLDQGDVKLEYEPKNGYLLSVLKFLQVPLSSQTLVFSKTSFQQHLISPASPRALYFNDDVYIGWVRGGEVVEISSVDPDRGAIFYTLDQRKSTSPKFVRKEECLQCHASPKTLGVPGHMVRSVYPDSEGVPQLQAGSFLTDHSSPFKERWGGWYVTGTHGAQRHMGNNWVSDKENPERLDLEAGANITNLRKWVDVSAYASPGSDLVALMVLEHQVRLHNLLTRANWETRLALSQQEAMNRALGQPLDRWSDSTRSRIHGAVENVLKYLLFADEVKLEEPVAGTSGFQEEFPKAGPKDQLGRSLRDFDLKRRLFRYPCSFLIYSEAFDALPKPALDYLYRRLWEILSGDVQEKTYSNLGRDDRQAIFEILLETKTNLPAYWSSKAAGTRYAGPSHRN